MIRTHLPRKIRYPIVALAAIFFLAGKIKLMLLTALVYLVITYLFRKRRDLIWDDPSVSREMIVAPVSGRVKEVKEVEHHPVFGDDLIVIEMKQNTLGEYGICLPTNGEITNLLVDRKSKKNLSSYLAKIKRLKQSGSLFLSISTKLDGLIGVEFRPNALENWPELCVIPGDRGVRKAGIGYFPFGGTVLLYMSKNYEILINNQMDVVMGESVLARLDEKTRRLETQRAEENTVNA